jgi:hypothetical protein
MWLFVPITSTSSPSAQAEPDLISASSWQFQALAQSAWSRGKPSPSRTWFQRWNKVSFIRLLCGAMPDPSTADAGVDAWTASLAASRASLIALPESAKAPTTNATSGQQPAASSSNRAFGLSSSKMSRECSRRSPASMRARYGSGVTYSDWVSTLREDCSRRQRSARATSANASSSSAWITPRANENDESPESWQVRRMRMAPADRPGETGTLTLQAKAFQASAWPTPTANDWKGSGPTLERKDGQMRGDRLDYATEQLWSTPRASDGEKGGPNQAFGAGGVPLPAQTVQWPTPTSLSFGDSHQPGNSRSYNETMRLASFLPGQATSPVGDVPLKERRSLNPLFVEWLMGWPPGWTLGVWIDFACSATELSRFKQRMRSALSQLALPAEAPPAQLALFG